MKNGNYNNLPAFHEEDEMWAYQKPKRADHIKVSRGVYKHHGIFVSKREVIHFAAETDDNLLGNSNTIHKTTLKKFLKEGNVEVKIYNSNELEDLHPTEIIVKIARALIGDDGYNLAFNNCEHFANYCTLGEHKSFQVEKVLNPLKRRKLMGLFWNKDKNITTTTYEPDKVRVAEIENKTKILLKKMETENITLQTDLQKELVDHMIEAEKTLIQAKITGYGFLLKKIQKFNDNIEKMRIEKHLELGKAQNESEKEIISYYNDFFIQLDNRNSDFELNHMPKLNEQRDSYEEGTASYETYSKMIDKRLEQHLDNQNEEVRFFRKQRGKRLKANRKLNEIVTNHLNDMNIKMLEIADNKSKLLEISKNEKVLLEQNKMQLLETNVKDEKTLNPVKNINGIDEVEVEPVDNDDA